jgi:hypothetical protein
VSEITVSVETLRKFLKGFEGDKRLKNWSIDWITERLEYEDRDRRIGVLAREWMNHYVRTHEWDKPSLREMWKGVSEECNGDKTDMIESQVGYLMESVDLVWDSDTGSVIWNPHNHNTVYFDQNRLPELLFYVNEQIRSTE